MQHKLTQLWYRDSLHAIGYLLLPFSLLFGWIVSCRRALYKAGIFKSQSFNAPVIVIGNITVGGTGKTPFVIWLATLLQKHGFKPGIVSRGVGGETHQSPQVITENESASKVGDEALLMQKRANCPVIVCKNRSLAVNALINEFHCDIIISDDGLQHYAMQRDIEIAILDGDRRLGNFYLLPAGPLREPIERLSEVDFIVTNGEAINDEVLMQLEPSELVSFNQLSSESLTHWKGKTVHAIAGIGNPDRFFKTLQAAGITVIPHAFPDHYLYQARDLEFNDELPILMTEKDAVKCFSFAKTNMWYLPVCAVLPTSFSHDLLTLIQTKKGEKQ